MKPLPLTQPCAAAWEDMSPVAQDRHCDRCDRMVYDLERYSETRVRVLATFLGPGGFCARQVIDERGDLVLAPAAVPVPRAGRWAGPALAVLSVASCVTAVQAGKPPSPLPAVHVPPDCPPVAPPVAPRRPGPDLTARPTADRDGDGVPDRSDSCPDAAGNAPSGCPSLVQVGGMSPKIRLELWFKPRSTAFTRDQQPELTEIAQVLHHEPQLRHITIIGHAAANEGSGAAARVLGQQRAEFVRQALIDRGVEPERLLSASWGSERPRESGSSPAANAHELNRRVEFQICDRDAGASP